MKAALELDDLEILDANDVSGALKKKSDSATPGKPSFHLETK